MKASIKSVHNHGDFDKEYVLISVLGDCDIGKYILADTTYTGDNQVSNHLRHMYWFPDKQVRAGDQVIVYTKNGKNSERAGASGETLHTFYWGLKVPVWNDDGDCAILIEAMTWQLCRARKA